MAMNGVVVTGSIKVTLDSYSYKESVGQISSIAPEIVTWIKGELDAQ